MAGQVVRVVVTTMVISGREHRLVEFVKGRMLGASIIEPLNGPRLTPVPEDGCNIPEPDGRIELMELGTGAVPVDGPPDGLPVGFTEPDGQPPWTVFLTLPLSVSVVVDSTHTAAR
ncbi:hypothetical protein OEA41_002645 [Lepraria neglecta]|uniref:Uncharacterized protein n=1 Tax=Lepraria neglecta TaxID=209136 RepID=A0AAD9Z2V2_9LECA|nr:hypothetical protein OEA41_002645 [Lepraria neglecta]